MILERTVELTSPPISTRASGEISGFEFNAIGINPQMAVMEVKITGRKRISPASSIASCKGLPCWRSWFVKSTSKIEFFTSTPASPIKPIIVI